MALTSMHRRIYFIFACFLFVTHIQGQETLPKFSTVKRGTDRIIISWINPYGEKIRQLSIQRSFDSIKNFKTNITIPDPTVPQNGYVDSKATNDHMFYRLFILLDSGKYVFSNPMKPSADAGVVFSDKPTVADTIKTYVEKKDPVVRTDENNKAAPKVVEKVIIPERMIYVKKRDTLMGQISEKMVKRFRDSVNLRTKDTFSLRGPDTIVIKTYIPREIYKPSKFVFTEKDGNVRILLPDAPLKKYSIKFFEDDNSPLFEIKKVPESVLVLDKSNFFHAGWFKFELYQDGILKEKHKFYIPKEF